MSNPDVAYFLIGYLVGCVWMLLLDLFEKKLFKKGRKDEKNN